MPNRYLRDGILTSDAVNGLPPHAELFYRRLMSVVDDWGRSSADPRILRPACYPLQLDRVRESDLARWLKDLEAAGLVLLYTMGGKQYLMMQKVDKPRAKSSKCPTPIGWTPPPEWPVEIVMQANVSTCAQTPTNATNAISIPISIANANTGGTPPPPTPPESIPEALKSYPEFMAAWADWEEMHRERKKKIAPTARKLQLRKCEEWGASRATAALIHSTAQGYTGLYEDRNHDRNPKPATNGGYKQDRELPVVSRRLTG